MNLHDTPLPDAVGCADWLAAARGGSPEALGQLLESYRRYLLLVANGELSDALRAKVAASDVVQEAFLEAQQGFGAFRGGTPGEFAHWLRRILLHNLANHRRSFQATEMRCLEREVVLASPDLAAATPTPSRCAVEAEEQTALTLALDRLPEDYRRVLQWRHREGLDFAEIGKRLDRSPDAARKLWARAVLALRESLGGH